MDSRNSFHVSLQLLVQSEVVLGKRLRGYPFKSRTRVLDCVNRTLFVCNLVAAIPASSDFTHTVFVMSRALSTNLDSKMLITRCIGSNCSTSPMSQGLSSVSYPDMETKGNSPSWYGLWSSTKTTPFATIIKRPRGYKKWGNDNRLLVHTHFLTKLV